MTALLQPQKSPNKGPNHSKTGEEAFKVIVALGDQVYQVETANQVKVHYLREFNRSSQNDRDHCQGYEPWTPFETIRETWLIIGTLPIITKSEHRTS